MTASPNWQHESLEQTRARLKRPWGDHLMTILVINPINLRLVRIIAHTPVTPNQITLFSFFLTIMSGICLSFTSHKLQIIGGLLLLTGFLLDCLDGDLARYKGLNSVRGAMLDPLLDKIGWTAVLFAISINGRHFYLNEIWLLIGIITISASLLYYYITDAVMNPLRNRYADLFNNKKQLMVKDTPVVFGTVEPFIWGEAALAFAGLACWGVLIFGAMFIVANGMQIIRLIRLTGRIQIKQHEHHGIHVEKL